jgi:hypothetical protein
MVSSVPDLEIPGIWEPVLAQWDLAGADAMLSAFRNDRHPVHQVASPLTVPEVARFVGDVHAALAGPARSVMIAYPERAPVTTAMLLVGQSLGGICQTCEFPLIGPVETDIPSTAIRNNSQEQFRDTGHAVPSGLDSPWHTDCQPWQVPAPWTVLGMNFCDPAYADAPTDIEPVWHIRESWTDDPAYLDVLRTQDLNWRQLLPQLSPVPGPVLGSPVTRWLPYVTPAELADDTTALGRACRALDRYLKTCQPLYQPVLRPGRLLLIDNHRMIHRGPVVAEPQLRRISKVKIGGVPDAVGTRLPELAASS